MSVTQHIAPCGHPGRPVFNTMVVCEWCDYGKTPPPPPGYRFLMYAGAMPGKTNPDNGPAIGELMVPAAYVQEKMFIVPTGKATVFFDGVATYYRLKNMDGKVITEGAIQPFMSLTRANPHEFRLEQPIGILP